MPQGQRERQPKNLSVLFLDRSFGPWYRCALEWSQDSDLKNSSGFCGPGSALLQEVWHEPVRTKIREKQSWLAWWSCTAGNCQWTQISSLATHDLLKLVLLLGKGWAPANAYPANKNLWCFKPPTWRHRYWLSSRSVVCQTAMFTNILPPLTA